MQITKIEKNCSVSVPELYVYTGVAEWIIDKIGTEHNMFFYKKKEEKSSIIASPLFSYKAVNLINHQLASTVDWRKAISGKQPMHRYKETLSWPDLPLR